MIGDIENTIRFQAADIGSIMLELNRQNDYAGLSFIPAFNAGAKSGKSLQESMAGAVSLSQNKMQLNERDCELLRSFFQKLGTTDMEGQIKNCQYYKIRMEEQYREAKTAFEQKGRLYIFLGFFAGLAFALLMI